MRGTIGGAAPKAGIRDYRLTVFLRNPHCPANGPHIALCRAIARKGKPHEEICH
jgi:hypothetical protein